jgi:amino acid permease
MMTSLLPWILFPAVWLTIFSILVSGAFGSLRGGMAFILAAWLVVLAIWLQHWFVSSQPGYNAGPGGGLGVIFMSMITIGIALGTVSFGIIATWWTRKR